MWAIFLLDQEFDLHLSEYGLYPRKAEGLLGIFTIPFIHGSFSHIINNSVPMLVLGWALFRFYPTLAFKTLFWILIISGIWLWISGRSSYHIGASGVVYGLAAFLFLSGWLRREKRVAALSLLVAFLYGSMWWGVLPVDPTISWEGHLWGAVAGFSLAFLYRKQGPQKPVYQWELEDDLPDEGPWNMQEKARDEKRPGQSNNSNIEITYTIVSPKKKDEGSKSN
jgi:membrane associated rhomboid family serine protease